MGAPASDPKLSEAGVVPQTSRAPTSMIPSSSKGRLGSTDEDWIDFVNRDHNRHPELTRSQVEFTLISMRKYAIHSNLPLVAPTDKVIKSRICNMRSS